jgi:signal peptidase I
MDDKFMETRGAIACELAAEVNRRFGSLQLLVSGSSMVPAVRPGDVIHVKHSEVGDLSRGDIVVFRRAGRLIAHRAMRTSGKSAKGLLVTRGDRVPREDAPILGSELLGRVVAIERNGERTNPRSRFDRSQRAIGRLLSFSDRATSLFLRLAAR